MSLTNTTIKNLRPKGKMFKVSDAKGLCLEISPKGVSVSPMALVKE